MRHHLLPLGVLLMCCGSTRGQVNNPASLVSSFQHEIQAGLDRRNVRSAFDRYMLYTVSRLDAATGGKQWNDKTGNCRLTWFNQLIRDQLNASSAIERFSRELHGAFRQDHRGLVRAVEMMGDKIDVPLEETGLLAGRPVQGAKATLRQALCDVRAGWDAAVEPLSEEQRNQLRESLYRVTTGEINTSGARFVEKPVARKMCDLLEAMDRQGFVTAAAAVSALCGPQFWQGLESLSPLEIDKPRGVTGAIHSVFSTTAGKVLVGGKGPNQYALDELEMFCAVIDLGGDDLYLEGRVSSERPVLVTLDLAGNDLYQATKSGVQGGGLLGVSILIDCQGNDIYESQDIAQGACMAGVGILYDGGGDDSYRGRRRVQGSAMGGLAFLLDRSGADRYHAALYAQGLGGPLGIGVLDDLEGEDHYFAGGQNPDAYDDSPGYAAWSQGVGAGPRGTANGGIGVLLDGGGDDVYECDYFSHGGGYWFAVGVARDFGGNDQRLGSTRVAYDGSARGEPRFLRWGIGWQAHYGLGFVIDDCGNDYYGGNTVGLGFSWDIGVAALLDFDGADRYDVPGASQGQGAEAALGLLFDGGGNDVFTGEHTGSASAQVNYHPLPDCGGNFSFSIHYGGQDTYGGVVKTEVDQEVSSPHGFMIHRTMIPTED